MKAFWMGIAVVSVLTGCASSSLTRDATDQAQAIYASGNAGVGDAATLNPGRSWQASTQTTKGILLGGAAGGVAGGLTSGIGWVPGAFGGAIFGGAMGAWVDASSSSSDQLLNRGANVMMLGDQIRVVLLSSDVFEGHSAIISPHAYRTLDGVAQFISRYPNRRVTVAAFSDPGDPPNAGRAFTTAQAESVMRYLWRSGVNTRMLYAVGYGGAHPVARPYGSHPGDNCRIEISLEHLPV